MSWSGEIDENKPCGFSDESTILGSQRGLSARDRFDCLTCDCVFVNLLGADLISKGTLIEVGLAASSISKPIVLLMEENGLHKHPMLLEYCQIHIKPDINHDISDPDVVEHYLDTSAKVIASILCPEAH